MAAPFMKVGGKFYLAQVQQQKRYINSNRLNRRALEAQRQAIQFYGQALFSTQILHGQETTRLALQQVIHRLSDATQARVASLDTFGSGAVNSKSSPRHAIDRRV